MVIVIRDINGKRSAAKFNIADIQAGRAPDQPVPSGGLIVADSSALKQRSKCHTHYSCYSCDRCGPPCIFGNRANGNFKFAE